MKSEGAEESEVTHEGIDNLDVSMGIDTTITGGTPLAAAIGTRDGPSQDVEQRAPLSVVLHLIWADGVFEDLYSFFVINCR